MEDPSPFVPASFFAVGAIALTSIYVRRFERNDPAVFQFGYVDPPFSLDFVNGCVFHDGDPACVLECCHYKQGVSF